MRFLFKRVRVSTGDVASCVYDYNARLTLCEAFMCRTDIEL